MNQLLTPRALAAFAVLSLPMLHACEGDARPIEGAFSTDDAGCPIKTDTFCALDSEDGHEPAMLSEPPRVGLPEPSLIDLAEVPAHVIRELNMQSIEKAIVGSADTRVAVRDTSVAPYSSVVQVLTQWFEGAEAIPCTGTLVAGDAVLTAAHCIYNSARTSSGYPYSVSVVPGLYPKSPLPTAGVQFNAPFGVGYAKKVFVPDRFKAADQQAWARVPFDYAVLRLKVPFAKAVRTRSIGAHDDLLAHATILDGYHEDRKDCLQMFSSKDRVRKVLDNGSFNHFTDLKPGASGAGIVGSGSWANTVFGVQSAHVDSGNRYNIAATITPDKLRTIRSWVTRAL